MPDNSRAQRRALAYLLAVPVFAIVYVGVFATRVWDALRPAVAVALGATVIGSVYADEAIKRAPATPVKAGATLALAFVLIGHGMAPAPTAAAGNPAEAVIAAAREYLGRGYQLGAEGPKQFDCSGLLYRVFLDVGELPRIGGMRLRAVGYMRWFIARGQFTRRESEAERGDLVVWDRGEHIGIYLGDGKALSALVDPYGVSVHSLRGIHLPVDYFLKVDWRNGDAPGDGNGNHGNTGNDNGNNDPGRGPGNGDSTGSGADEPNDNPDNENPGNGGPGGGPDNGSSGPDHGNNPGNGDNPGSGTDTQNPDSGDGDGDGDGAGSGSGDNGTENPPPPDEPSAIPDGPRGGGKQGFTTGTLNIRVSADPEARIVGWLGKNRTVSIVDHGNSPAGYVWFRVETASGQSGWVFSHWVRQL